MRRSRQVLRASFASFRGAASEPKTLYVEFVLRSGNYVCRIPVDSRADKRFARREHHISPMILTESRNHRTWRSEPNQSIYLRRGPGDESFECQLPAEARIELEEPHPPPLPKPRIRVRATYGPAQIPPPLPEVFLRPSPPISSPRPPLAYQPGVSSRNGKNRTLRPSKDHSIKRKRSRTRYSSFYVTTGTGTPAALLPRI